MLLSEFKDISVRGISSAVPDMPIDVLSFKNTFSEEGIVEFSKMTGVKSIHRAKPSQTASDLGYIAASDVIEKTGGDPGKIGILIFVTQKPDVRVPSTAFILHNRLGLSKDCICFDLNLACSGFMFGLHTALSMLQSSDAEQALVLTGDTSVRTFSPLDRTVYLLFGDAGTATLLQKDKGADPIFIGMRTDGSRFKSIITPSGAYRNMDAPLERTEWGDGIMRSDYDTHMKGMDVFGFSITDVPKLLKDFLNELGKTSEDYDCFAMHQANMYILKQLSRKLKIPADKLPVSIDRFGNTSSNSVPLTLSDRFGSVQGEQVKTLMSGFGAGLSLACAEVNLLTNNIFPVIKSNSYYKEQLKNNE